MYTTYARMLLCFACLLANNNSMEGGKLLSGAYSGGDMRQAV